VLLGLIGAGLGVAEGFRHQQTYSSTATVSSARVGVIEQGLPGYVEAATSLASTYSRIVMSDAVEARVAARLHLPLAIVRGHVTATPTPDDPVLTIVGTAPTAAGAQRLASTTAQALNQYVTSLIVDPIGLATLIREYTSATNSIDRLNQQIRKVSASASAKSAASLASLHTAHLALARLSLQIQAIASSYVDQTVSGTSGANPQILTAAGPATSDRESKVEDYGLIGLAAGLIVGLLGVGLRSRRRAKAGPVVMSRPDA
jgi:hypothetical protein